MPLNIDPTVWPALSRLLDTALEMPVDERASWVESLDARHDALKPQLRDLLAQARMETGDILGTLPRIDAQSLAQGRSSSVAGEVVGPYRLLRQIGSGGMGSVWLAERTDGVMKRPVALKLPHVTYDSDRRKVLAERMAREREILAALNHPHITTLYDAGVTASGQPYLALEYVKGEAIDHYCSSRELPVRERLKLFVQVAHAVAYAHGMLVVHRDLKPSNILVTEGGQVQLLDFGVAKLLAHDAAEKARLTELSGRALTPDYASPEQILGAAVTTSSDVYSLGVILYELLTGGRPYRLQRDSRGALEEAILTTEPLPPSAAVDRARRVELAGDVDTIVMTALHKQVGLRYATVHAFADDVQRYLEHRPILARPDSRWYRTRMFIRRNRLAVGATTTVLCAVIVASTLIAWQSRIAVEERQRAQHAKDFIASILQDADPYETSGDQLSVVGLLERARERVDRELAAQPAMQVEMLDLIGGSLKNLQATESSAAALNEAVAVATRSLGPEHPLATRARVTRLGLYRYQGNNAAIRSESEQLLPLLRRRGASALDLVDVLQTQAHLAIDEARNEQAVALAKEAYDLALRTLGESHDHTANGAVLLAMTYEYAHQPVQALQAAEQALALQLKVHGGMRIHGDVVNARVMYGRALGEAGRLGQAIEVLDVAIQDARQRFGDSGLEVGFFCNNLARYLLEAGEVDRAIVQATNAVRIFQLHPQADTHFLPVARMRRALSVLTLRDAAAAANELSSVGPEITRIMGPVHPFSAGAREASALAQVYLGHFAAAKRVLEPALQGAERWRALHILSLAARLQGDRDGATRLAGESIAAINGPRSDIDRMRALPDLGLALVAQGSMAQAKPVLQQAQLLMQHYQTAFSPERADTELGLGRIDLAAGDAARAVVHLQAAESYWRSHNAQSRWAGESAYWLARAHHLLGREAEATADRSRAVGLLRRSPLPVDVLLLKAMPRG